VLCFVGSVYVKEGWNMLRQFKTVLQDIETCSLQFSCFRTSSTHVQLPVHYEHCSRSMYYRRREY